MADERDDKANDPPVSSYLRRPRRTLQEAEKAIALSGPEPIGIDGTRFSGDTAAD